MFQLITNISICGVFLSKETKVPETRLECLKETIGEEDCMQKTLSALENMEPSLEAIQKDGKNDLYLNPDSVYNFWKYVSKKYLSHFT